MKQHPIYGQLFVATEPSRGKNNYTRSTDAFDFKFGSESAAQCDKLVSAQARVLQNLSKMNEETNRELIRDVQRQIEEYQARIERFHDQESSLQSEQVALRQRLLSIQQQHWQQERQQLERDICVCRDSLASCADKRKLALGQQLAHLRSRLAAGRTAASPPPTAIINASVAVAPPETRFQSENVQTTGQNGIALCKQQLNSFDACIAALKQPASANDLKRIQQTLERFGFAMHFNNKQIRVAGEHFELHLLVNPVQQPDTGFPV